MVAMVAMVVCLGASATDKLTRSLDHENALTSLEDLQLATFALQTGDVVLYTPKDWDIKVASFADATSNGDNGVFYKLDAVDAHFRMELYNFNQKRRTYWGSNLAYVNSQPAGQTVIFGLSGASPKFGQDGQDLALWDITYEAGNGFAFKCVGRTDGSIYIGHDGTAARAVSEITYWQAYPLAYKASEVEAAATEVLAAIKLSDSKKAIEDAKTAYASEKSFANLTKYGDAVNAAIDDIAAAEAINKAYASIEVAKAVADQYAAGKVKSVSELGNLYREAVKSQKFAGADMTGAIVNFDCAAKEGWTFDKPKGGNGPDHGGDFEYWAGNASDRATASFDYWQEITGLPNGTYTVSAEMYNSLNGEGGDYTEFKPTCGVYATVGEKTVSKLVDTNSETRVPYETEAIEVTDGKIRIGVKSFEAPMAARWFTVDNFKLTLVEPAKAPAPEKEKWFTDNTFCYKDAANNVSRSMELPWVADPDDPTNGCIELSSAAKAANDHDLQFMIRGAEYDGADLMKGAFAEGTGFKVTFRVKADGNYTGCLVGAFNSIVASGKDGWKHSYYLGNQSVKMDVTTEWQTVSYSVLATADDAGKLTAIGFNLAEKDGDARKFYFDDVKISPLPWYNEKNFNVVECIDGAIAPQGFARYNAENDYIEVTTNDSPTNEWDCQIWMKVSDVPLLPGSTFTLDFEWKADREQGGIATQHHKAFSYIHYDGWGSYTAKTDWTPVSIKGTVSKNGPGMQCVCFNLSDKTNGANHFYIRNVEVSANPLPDEWYNKVKFTDKFKPSGVDQNKPAEFKFGEDGNGYIEITTLDNPVDAWDNQFFIQIADLADGGKFHKNDKVTMKFKAMAITDAEAYKDGIQTDGQFHRSPDGAGYIGNVDKVDIPVGAWSDVITKTFTITDPNVTNYCMNLSLAKGNAPIVYRFDDFEFEFEAGTDDWYTKNVIVAKDPTKDYTDGQAYEFPEAPYNYDEGCIEVKSKAEPANAWASQIFFSIPEALVGKNVKISMKVKASEAIDIDAQRHADNSGAKYGDNYAAGNISFTTEWTPVSFNFDPKKGEDVMACYVLNIGKKGNVSYFFDDVSIQEDFGALVEATADGTLIAEKDWTKETSYSGWSGGLPDGYNRSMDNGIVLENTSDEGDPWSAQFEVINGLSNLKAGAKYSVRLTMKIQGEGDLQVNFGDWGTTQQYLQTLENGYRQVVWEYPSWASDVASGVHALFQGRKFKGTIILEKVEVFEDYLDPATLNWTDNLFTNGDIEGDDVSAFYAKVNSDADGLILAATTKNIKSSNQIEVVTAAREADPENEGKFLGNDHDTQFFVRLPYALAKGTKYYFSVDYLATKVADVQSQTHAEPGEWKSNNGVGKITTGSAAQTLAGYFTADNDMRTLAFNLASATEGGKFYFDNFVFKVVVEEEADIKAFTQTWDETSKWNETLALNVAYDNGRNAETEGCTEESVKALDDAMAAGKAILQPAEGAEPATKDAIAAAAKAIEDAIAGLEKGKPELAYTDLTKEMFFHWNAADETAEALEASNCDYNIGTSTGQPYGLSTVNHDRFADLSAYNTIELTATEGEPRLLFNRIENEGTVFAEVPRDKDKYETVVDNGDGSKTYVIDIAAIVAEYGFAHLHAIKGANWANTTVTEIKLGYVGEKPELPIPTAIEGVETEGESIADGKYIENGQIVIVKGGKKYTAAGVEIK